MTQVSYPGVYIEELSSGVHTITGVATSITAFVGSTKRGLDNRAKQILSLSDFDREFGGLAADSELSYAVRHFFSNGGSRAYVVRVPRKGATSASVILEDKGGKKALQVTALSTGTWANGLLADVDYDGFPSTDTTSYNLTITDPATGASEDFVVTQDSTKSNYVVSAVNDEDNGSQLVNVAVPDASAGRPMQSGVSGGDITLPLAGPIAITVTSDAPTTGTTITNLAAPILDTGDTATTLLGLARVVERKLNLALGKQLTGAAVICEPNENGKGLRIIANFSQDLLPGTADAKLTFTGADAATLKINTASSDTNVAHYVLGGSTAKLSEAYPASPAGSDGTSLPTTTEIIGNPAANPPTGIYALEKVDLFNILCIPDATRAAAGNPNALDANLDPQSIFSAALDYCKSRRAFLIVDPPPEINNVDRATDWKANVLSNLGESYGAAYFPRARLSDPLNDYQLRTFAPCGIIAGLYARIDATRGVWKAPAGTEATLNDVQSFVYKLTDAENGVLNPLGLNCLRTFPVYGNLCWGARTLRGADDLADEWKYIPVRRFALYIEESLYRGTKWAVFEPNAEPLWAQIRLNIGAFMHTLFEQSAFAGSSAKEAYLVKCDRETTTQDDVNRGVVNILVGFAPLKPAEFVVIKIQQLAGQIQT